MKARSFLLPEGESQQAEGLLEAPLLGPLGVGSLWFLGLSLLSTTAGLKGNKPVLLLVCEGLVPSWIEALEEILLGHPCLAF